MADERKLNGSPSINKDYYYYYYLELESLCAKFARSIFRFVVVGNGLN